MAVAVSHSTGDGTAVMSDIEGAIDYEVVEGHLHLIKEKVLVSGMTTSIFMSFAPGSWFTVEIVEIVDTEEFRTRYGKET